MDNSPTILIISFPEDSHAQVVIKRLETFQPKPRIIFLNTQFFLRDWSISVGFNGERVSTKIILKDEVILGDEIRSIWWRRPKPVEIPTAIADEAHEFIRRESRHALKGLWANLHHCFWINPPLADRAAAKKMHQLEVAQSLGMRIPDTLVTNYPQEARAFIKKWEGRVIYKQLRGTKKIVKTSMVGPEEEALLEQVQYSPVIFQECIPAKYDLRITVFGKDIYAAKILSQEGKSTLDWRFDSGNKMEKYSLPTKIEQQIRSLMQTLGIFHGAIDIRVTPDGEYVFLEVNPSGQFVFVEILTGMPLSEVMASCLYNGGE